MVIAATAAMALLAGGGAAAYFALAKPSAAYQPLSYAGPVPFTAPVGVDNPAVAPIADASGTRSGDTPGLFAADPAHPACDAGALISALQADPGKASVWAGVLGGTADQIPTIVNSLTPVQLRAATAVVDHGFADGQVVDTPAVLAPGTAVFIDARGVPTVKCVSGDPLTAPLPGTVPSTATVINPTAAADQGQRLREPGDGTVDEQSGQAGPTRPRQRWRRPHAIRRPEPGQAGSQGRRSCCPGAAAGQPGA